MTKTKTPLSSVRETNPSKQDSRTLLQIAYAKYVQSLRNTSASTKILLVLFCIGFALTIIFAPAGIVSLAMLYSIADNGKKSGRSDGNVYMRNGRVRGFKMPSLVQNAATTLQRVSFGGLSSGWNALTETQRNSWLNATGFSTIDRMGHSITLVGKQLYVALNRALFNAGQFPITTAPTPSGIAQPTGATLTGAAAVPALSLAFTPTPVPANTSYVVYATGMKSAGTARPGSSQFRLLKVMAAASASPNNLLVAYNARWGTLVAGRKVFVKIVAVNNLTGEESAGLVTFAIIAA